MIESHVCSPNRTLMSRISLTKETSLGTHSLSEFLACALPKISELENANDSSILRILQRGLFACTNVNTVVEILPLTS